MTSARPTTEVELSCPNTPIRAHPQADIEFLSSSPRSTWFRNFQKAFFTDQPRRTLETIASPPSHYIGRSFVFSDGPKTYKPVVKKPERTHRWEGFEWTKEELELVEKLDAEASDPLIGDFSIPEVAIIRATGPNYALPRMTVVERLSMRMRRRYALRKYPDVVPIYFYQGHETGPHLPFRVNFSMFDEELVYSDCPDLRAVLDDRELPIEYWHEDGSFRRLDPNRPLNCRYRRRLMIFRPGRQPADFLKNCIGFRELSYELFFSNMRIPCVPIKDGIAPAASVDDLKIDHTWELFDVPKPFKDVMFARGDDGPWETGSDYDSDTPQEEEPCPLLIRTKGQPERYNNILRKSPRFGWYVDRIGEQDGAKGKFVAFGAFETIFDDLETSDELVFLHNPPDL